MNKYAYIYAFTLADNEPPTQLKGIEGLPVERVTIGGISAIYSFQEKKKCDPEDDILWEHEYVLETFMKQGAVLPVQFGSYLSIEEVASLMESHREELLAELYRLEGCVELSLSVFERSDFIPAESPTWVHCVHLNLLELAVEGSLSVQPNSLHTFAGVYLVRKENVHFFQMRLGSIREQYPAYKFLCTGPWPAYSFVGGKMELVAAG